MPFIYHPEAPHICQLPNISDTDIRVGSLWYCDKCKDIFEVDRDDMSGRRVFVRLPKWLAKRRLKKLHLVGYLN